MRTALIVLVMLIALAIAGYFSWTASPYFTFQQVALAVKDRDQGLFEKYVDAPNIVDGFVDDLLVQPAMSTPHLSSFQQSVAGGALAMAKSTVIKGIQESINHYFLERPSQPQPTSCLPDFGCEPAIAAPHPAIDTSAIEATAPAKNTGANYIAQAGGTGEGIKELLHAAGHEMSSEVTKLKSVAFNRMLAYIQAHPNTVPGRLLNCPPSERSAHARLMLEEYGLTQKNFKGLGNCVIATDLLGKQSAKIGFNFFSPKISKQVTVEVQVDREQDSGVWRIKRLSNIKDVMDQEEEFYDRDIHELVEYSLSGMSNSNMASDMRGMTERLKQSPAAQNLLNKWHLNLR